MVMLYIRTADFNQINALFNGFHASLINYISITPVIVSFLPMYYIKGLPRVIISGWIGCIIFWSTFSDFWTAFVDFSNDLLV